MQQILSSLRFKKQYLLPIIILLIGIFLRFFQLRERFGFNHDQDLVAWFVKDILFNRHLRLIGQETSTAGFFIGPLYYYLQIPFFILTKMDPIAEAWVSSIIGVFGIISTYYVFSKAIDKKTALIAMFIYSVSFMVVRNDREAVMTMPVIIWSIWFYYLLFLISKGKQKSVFLLSGILIGLIWHINVALAVLVPVILIAFIMSKPKMVDMRYLFWGFVILIVLLSPFILFEIKHGFIQFNALKMSFVNPGQDIYYGIEKLIRIIILINRNISFFIFGNSVIPENYYVGVVLLIVTMLFVYLKKLLSRKMVYLLVFWLLLYIVFFSIFSKPVSEYYLNGLFAIYLLLGSIVLSNLLRIKIIRFAVIIILLLYGINNIWNVVDNYGKDGIHYTDKLALVREIKSDSMNNNFPCVSVSFITDIGYELGYRYLFFYENLKIKEIDKNIPTYTIVYPLGKDSVKEDNIFGYLGLLYPKGDYNPKALKEYCKGDNFNLTKPMWGLSQ